MKILSYNILEGLQHSKIQSDVFVEWVTNHDPDIIFYQELNGFTEEGFSELARRCGHPFAVKFEEDGYRPGLSSKYEITDIKRTLQNFSQGYIYAKIREYHVFSLHLNPFKETERLKEVQKLLMHAQSLPEDANIMLVGDFNSLAASDSIAYSDVDFGKYLRDRCPDWGVEFAVTDTLLNAGYHDAYALFHTDFKRTCPTLKRIFPGDAGVRIDYAFLNPALKEKCTSAEIVHDEITRFLSDHYPLIFTLQR